MPNSRPDINFTVHFIIIFVTLVSLKMIDYRTLTKENINIRNELQIPIAKGETAFNHEFGYLQPAAGYALQKVVNYFVNKRYASHIITYYVLNLIIFFLIYLLFYVFLKLFCSVRQSITGVLMLASVIVVSLNGLWPETGLINLLLFITGFLLMYRSYELYLPVVFFFGMLNDMHIIFLLVFYVLYLISENRISNTRSLTVAGISALTCAAVYFLLNSITGISPVDVSGRTSLSIQNPGLIFQQWLLPLFLILVAGSQFKSASMFFRNSFVAVMILLLLSILIGNPNAPGNFFPAYLILIPMCIYSISPQKISS